MNDPNKFQTGESHPGPELCRGPVVQPRVSRVLRGRASRRTRVGSGQGEGGGGGAERRLAVSPRHAAAPV